MNDEKILIKQFFQNFLVKEKGKDNISNEYVAFLKILWNGLDDLISKNKIARKIYILEHIEKYLIEDTFRTQIDLSELPIASELAASQDTNTPEITLKDIDLVNFRGFRANTNGSGRKIRFHEKVTLIFAPNGGGKTSLCESIEWALTGDTYEHTKRKTDSTLNYFQNRSNADPTYQNTKLSFLNNQPTVPNLIFDRCLLEKNRIDKFAKLAMQPNKDLQEILGELFGFSDVVDFFKEFGQDLSPTDNEKGRPGRENWQTWLEWSNKKSELEKILDESKKEEKKASEDLEKLTGEKSFDDKKVEIEEKGKELRIKLESLEKNSSKQFSTKSFQDKITLHKDKIEQWKKLDKDISDNAKDLDFESLFQAANNIFKNNYSDNKCPLCDTPIEQKPENPNHVCVVTSPQLKTEQELKKLKKLTDWKVERNKLEIDLKGTCFREIRDDWQKIQHNLIDENWKDIAGETEKPLIPDVNLIEIESKLDGNTNSFIDAYELILGKDFTALAELEGKVTSYKNLKDELLKDKPQKEIEIQNLRDEFAKLQEQKNILSAKQQITKSSDERLKKILNQSSNSDLFKKMLDVYPDFYNDLQNFQSGSILSEGADIDDYVTGFYRALNLHDNVGEIIKEIKFPKGLQEDFCLIFESNNTCNALDILSEGHLKTLGLAALLARAAKYNTSLLVFDDAINAIDSDHRDNIACLLSGSFSDEEGVSSFGEKWDQIKQYIKVCQFVITSHDRFFDEKIANLFSKDEQLRYVLYCGAEGVDFCEKGNPANFEAKVEGFLNPDTQDVRSAIFYCRIWLEEILMDIAANFKKPSNGKQIDFSNTIDKKSRKLKNPELATVIRSLVSNLKVNEASDDEKITAGILDQIYQEKEGKYIWFFEILNQESHYRRLDHVDISNAPTSNEVQAIFNKIQEIQTLNT
ncbi:MAG: AAA family ATPase [Patescibacteria group bacterium]